MICVLDLAHFSDRVGKLDQLGRSVAAGDDHVDVAWPCGDGGDDAGGGLFTRLKDAFSPR